MLKAAIRGVFTHKLRLSLTALSIMLGVGFVASAFIFTDTINGVFNDLFADAFAGTDVEVRVKDADEFEGTRPQRIPDELVDTISEVDGVQGVFGSVFGVVQLVGPDGELVQTGGPPSFATNWIEQIEATGFELREGRAPGPDEAMIDVATSERLDIGIGDDITVLSEREPRTFSVVGTAGFGEADSIAGAVFVLLEGSDAQELFDAVGEFDNISILASETTDAETVANRIQEVLPERLEAITSQSAAEEASAQIKDQLSFFQTFLLVFAGVSLFVGTFLIQNTFRIIVAQRTRELALLRAVGAYPSQIVSMVVVEALLVGVVASAAGVLAGMGLATLLRTLLESFGGELPEGPLVVMGRTVIVALLVGVLVTVVSALLPARKASRVPPVAAMRDVDHDESGSTRWRIVVGSIALALGLALSGFGLFATVPPQIPEIALIGAGAGLIFIGISILSHFYARPLARVVGWPITKVYRLVGDLSKENAVRNPQRTSATAAALMIGIALITVVTILAASARATATQRLDDNFRADLIISSTSFSPFGFSSEVAPRVASLDEVDAVHRERKGRAILEGQTSTITGVDVGLLDRVGRMLTVEGDLDDLKRVGTVAVVENETLGKGVGDIIEAEFAFNGEQELEVVAVYAVAGTVPGTRIVSLETYENNFVEVADSELAVLLAQGVSLQEGKDAIGKVLEEFPNVRIQDPSDLRAEAEDQLGGLLSFIQALLGLAIVIAVLGITNTLSLSIIERTREIGLLRAVGMSRRQIRKVVRWEAVIIAVFGGLVGVLVGLGFARAVVAALAEQGFTEFAIPAMEIGVWLLAAAFAGIIAAVLPAWRASRLDVLESIAYE